MGQAKAEDEKGTDREETMNATTEFQAKVIVGNVVKMFHFFGKDIKKIRKRAEKKGRVIGSRKVGIPDYIGSLNCYQIQQEPLGLYLGGGLYEKDIDLDEILGLTSKKKKRRGT